MDLMGCVFFLQENCSFPWAYYFNSTIVTCWHPTTMFSLTFSPAPFLWAGMYIYIIDLCNAWLAILLLFCISAQPFLNKAVHQWVTLSWGLSSFSLWRQFISSNLQVHFWHSGSPHIHTLHDDKLASLLCIITQSVDSEQQHGTMLCCCDRASC